MCETPFTTLTWGQILGTFGIVLEMIGLFVLISKTPLSYPEYYHEYIRRAGAPIKEKYERDKRELLKIQIPIGLGLLLQLLAVFIL